MPHAARVTLEETVRPRSVHGARPRGTLHLWSGRQAQDAARAAIQGSGSGWMMKDIEGAPTPEHARAKAEYGRAMEAERLRNPGAEPRLTKSVFDRIWGWRSARSAMRRARAVTRLLACASGRWMREATWQIPPACERPVFSTSSRRNWPGILWTYVLFLVTAAFQAASTHMNQIVPSKLRSSPGRSARSVMTVTAVCWPGNSWKNRSVV